MLRRSGRNARLVDGIISTLNDSDRLAGCALCLDPAPELVQAFQALTCRVAVLAVARGDGFANDPLTQRDRVLGAVNNHVGGRLADTILGQRGLKTDESVLDRAVAAEDFGYVLGDGAGEYATGRSALTDGLLGAVERSRLKINRVEPVWHL